MRKKNLGNDKGMEDFEQVTGIKYALFEEQGEILA